DPREPPPSVDLEMDDYIVEPGPDDDAATLIKEPTVCCRGQINQNLQPPCFYPQNPNYQYSMMNQMYGAGYPMMNPMMYYNMFNPRTKKPQKEDEDYISEGLSETAKKKQPMKRFD